MEGFKLGNGLKEGTTLGPLISPGAVDFVSPPCIPHLQHRRVYNRQLWRSGTAAGATTVTLLYDIRDR